MGKVSNVLFMLFAAVSLVFSVIAAFSIIQVIMYVLSSVGITVDIGIYVLDDLLEILNK